MVKQVAVVSGKGGTGKTTVVACLASMARPVVAADCDVDAANLALLLSGTDTTPAPFFAGQRAEVEPLLCDGCDLCSSSCRFRAISLADGLHASVDPLSCEGCGVCQAVCPREAVSMRSNLAGRTMVRDTATGPLVHARLGVAQDNSGKLVAEVRAMARAEALARGLDTVVIDGPPGIGCPVHAAVTGVDLLLAVTEPTPSGAHDLERLLELAGTFGLTTAVLINKADLSELYVQRIGQLARRAGAAVVGRLPFDPEISRLLARGQTPLSLLPVAEELRRAWLQVHFLIQGGSSHALQGGV